MTTATHEEIVQTWLRMSYEAYQCNWGTTPNKELSAQWNASDDTYINGWLLKVDHDFIGGWLLEVVERSTGDLRYIAIVEAFGEHDSRLYPHDCGIFFERTVDSLALQHWALDVIDEMVQAFYADMRKEANDE